MMTWSDHHDDIMICVSGEADNGAVRDIGCGCATDHNVLPQAGTALRLFLSAVHQCLQRGGRLSDHHYTGKYM